MPVKRKWIKGPRGGMFYINKNGNKVYRRKNTKKKKAKKKKASAYNGACTPTKGKRFAKRNKEGKCISFGDANMTTAPNDPGRQRSFCARHQCKHAKPGTARAFSCQHWKC